MKEEDKQEVLGMIAEAFQITPKGDVFINGATVTIATPTDAEAFWNDSELVKRFGGGTITKTPIEDELYVLKKKLTSLGNELVKVVSSLDCKAVELGVIKDFGIGLELDELARLTSELFNSLKIKKPPRRRQLQNIVQNVITHLKKKLINSVQDVGINSILKG